MKGRGRDLIERIKFVQVFIDRKVYVDIKRKFFFTFKDRKPCALEMLLEHFCAVQGKSQSGKKKLNCKPAMVVSLLLLA